MKRVTIYSKPECHLCDVVKEVVERVRRTHPFELEIRNILDNPADYERYKHEIPVVHVDRVQIARYRLSEVRLIDALHQPSTPAD